MSKEEQKAFVDTGKQAAYLHNGAFSVFKNSKQAEKIVFLFFSAILFGKDENVSMLLKMFGGEN